MLNLIILTPAPPGRLDVVGLRSFPLHLALELTAGAAHCGHIGIRARTRASMRVQCSMYSLVRWCRNLYIHGPEHVRTGLSSSAAQLEAYILGAFPWLIVELWHVDQLHGGSFTAQTLADAGGVGGSADSDYNLQGKTIAEALAASASVAATPVSVNASENSGPIATSPSRPAPDPTLWGPALPVLSHALPSTTGSGRHHRPSEHPSPVTKRQARLLLQARHPFLPSASLDQDRLTSYISLELQMLDRTTGHTEPLSCTLPRDHGAIDGRSPRRSILRLLTAACRRVGGLERCRITASMSTRKGQPALTLPVSSPPQQAFPSLPPEPVLRPATFRVPRGLGFRGGCGETTGSRQ